MTQTVRSRSLLRCLTMTAAGALVAASVLAMPATGTTSLAAPAHRTACGCELPRFGPGASYRPHFTPSDFSPNVTNRWFPLKVGRTLIYTGTKDGEKALNIVTTTNRTRRVAGVLTRVVEDRLYLDNVLQERTSDYYAQDRCGNVWYFGEDTATLDANGRVVSRDGTFHAHVDGAQPGIYMQAHPEAGRRFRQEWYAGHGEDTFKVIDLSAPIKVRYGSFKNALRTEERTALEPEVVDNKYFVAGIGEVFEGSVKGAREALSLVEIIS